MKKNDHTPLGKFKVSGTHIGKRSQYISKYVLWGSKFKLEREPDNKHDENAIKVLLSVKKGKYFLDIGYLPKDLAKEMAFFMDKGIKLSASFRVKISNEKTGKFIALYLNLFAEV